MLIVVTPSDAPAARPREVLPAALLRLASDERLVDQVRAGSERAFEAIFDRHRRPVLAFCRQMLGSQADAEDALQHTFYCAYRDLKRSQSAIALRPWLYAIARHRCLSVLRGRRERPVEELPQPAGDHLDAVIVTREDLRATLADVAQLPDDQRAALVMAELGDVSHDEIARVIGCRREKVKALVFQARTALAHDRAAREASCATIRDRIGVATGGGRNAVVRRHLRDCPGCRAFHTQLRAKYGALGVLLPGIGFKRAVLAVLPGLGGGGAAATVGAIGGGGLAVAGLAAVAIAGGGGGADAAAVSAPHAVTPRVAVVSERRTAPAAPARRRLAGAAAPLRPEPPAPEPARTGAAGSVDVGAALPAAGAADRRAAPEPVTEHIAAPAVPSAQEPGAPAAATSGDGEQPASPAAAEPHEPVRARKPPGAPKPEADRGPPAPLGHGWTPPGQDGTPGPPPKVELPAAAAGPRDHATGRERAAEVKPPLPSEAVAAR